MENLKEKSNYFGTEKISKILFKMAPPVMLAQLIQALYNLVDSVFVGKYSSSSLTALSIVYPLQLLMIALAVGTGVGINTIMSAKFGLKQDEKAKEYAGVGTLLGLILWALFAGICFFLMPVYARIQTDSKEVIEEVITYGRIVSVGSIGLFLESIWTKILQAKGNMRLPMIAQILGAVTNIILDPILIFGMFNLPKLGIAGAGIATIIGQIVAALVVMKKGYYKSPKLKKYPHYVKRIFKMGLPNILMQSAYTFYIFGLNLILSTFCDQAVTVLGLYYKWQTFCFIPLSAMQTCIVPIISFNYAANSVERCKKTLNTAIVFGVSLMMLGMIFFLAIPETMLRVFTSDEKVIEIGIPAFRIACTSFIPIVTSLTYPVLFQAVGESFKSSILTIIRTVILYVPLGYLFSRFGLNYFWLTYPVTDGLTSVAGYFMSKKFFKEQQSKVFLESNEHALKDSTKGVIITIAREHGSCGKQIGIMLAKELNIPFYYKELTAIAAKESGLASEFIADLNKNSAKKIYDLYLSTEVVQHAIIAQKKIIEEIAKRGSCVIVGRAADYILKDHEDVVKIFIKANKETKINNIMTIYGDSYKEAERNIKKRDAARSKYYTNISGEKWGNPSNYDLVIDSSEGTSAAVKEIKDYLKEKNLI